MSYLVLNESGAPSTPAATKVDLYADNTANPLIKYKDDGGNVRTLIENTLSQTITGVKTMTNMTTAAGTLTIPSFTITNGTNLTTALVNAIENDAVVMYATVNTTEGRAQMGNLQIFRTTGDGSAVGAAIADFFPATSSFATTTNGVYELDYYCYYTKTTNGTVTFTLTNTQTYTNLDIEVMSSALAGVGTQAAPLFAALVKSTAAASALPVSGTVVAATQYAHIHAIAACGTAGNIRLRITQGAGTATLLTGSYYTVRKLSGGNVGAFVA